MSHSEEDLQETAERVSVELSADEKRARLDHRRVLILFGGIPLHGQERGNIEVFRSMSDLGLKAKFITHRQWGHLHVQPELTRQGFEWTTARFGPLIGRNLLGPDFFRIVVGVLNTNWVLWREVKRWRPTHLHAMNWIYVVYASPLIFLLQIPLIYRLGDCPPRSTFLHRYMWRLLCRRTSVMVCISKFVEGELRRSEGNSQRIQLIYNTVSARRESLPPIQVEDISAALRLAYIGQISAEKGIPILVQAVRQLLSKGRNVVLHLAGDYTWRNPMAAALIAKLKEDKLERLIQFLGNQENIPAVLQNSDLHVCPSIWGEPLGGVVLEAKAQGIPSVVFPDGGLPEMIEHKIDGFICADKTVEALVEGICWFLDHPEELEKAGEAARRSFEEKFGPGRFQREWAEVFASTWKSQP